MKIKEYYKMKKDKNSPLLGVLFEEEGHFSEYYNENSALIDHDIMMLYGEMLTVNDEELDIDFDIAAAYEVNKWQIDLLWKVNESEFNPLFNVDADIEQRTHYSQQDNTDSFGEDKTTTRSGERKSTSTSTGKEASYESNTFSNADENISQTTMDSVTDTASRDAHSDQHTLGEHDVLFTERRKGNIGVTRSDQLLEATAALALKLNAVKSIMLLILSDVCEVYYGN